MLLASSCALQLGPLTHQFSVLEMQAILAEILENFKLDLPPDRPDIQRVPAGQIMTPFIRGKVHLGPQMPLQVSFI